MARSEDFVTDGEMAAMRQAEIDHPATEHTNAGGWCKHCGCGNDLLGHKHLPACNRPDAQPSPIHKIQAERKRQIEVEGYTAAHDDEHSDGSILRAAVLYYANAKIGPDDRPLTLRVDGAPVGWPWEAQSWKPKDRERDLIMAGALCLAERERLRRIKGSYRGHIDQKLALIVQALSESKP